MRAFLLLALTLLLAVACGGGGGSSSDSSTMSTRFKASDLYEAKSGDRIVITDTSDRSTILNQHVDLDTYIEVELEPSHDYILAVYCFGIPAWRTMVLSSQLEAATKGGVVDLGELNALTTFMTSTMEMKNFGERSKSLQKPPVISLLNEYFGESVNSMADLRYSPSLPEGTEALTPYKNRIALLMIFLEWVGELIENPSATEIEAMQNLYAAIFDAESAVDLTTALSSPALPPPPPNATLLAAELQEQGFLYEGEGLLSAEDLYNTFFNPQDSLTTIVTAFRGPKGQVQGSIVGAQKHGIQLDLTNTTYAELSYDTTTDSEGTYSIKGIPEGTYLLKPSSKGYVFDPPAYSIEISATERKAELNFTSFTLGSTKVPEPSQVLEGVSYLSASGNRELFGSLTLPPEGNVLSGVQYGPDKSLEGTLVVKPNTVEQAPAPTLLLGTQQTSHNSTGSISVRH